MSARMLLLCVTLISSTCLYGMNAKDAHKLIEQQKPDLLGDGSQLVSLYYFGQNKNTAIVGLERVGDNYLPIRWLLVFEGDSLLGWYYPSDEFPASFQKGHLMFPQGSQPEDIYLWPTPPKKITIENTTIPFYSIESQVQ